MGLTVTSTFKGIVLTANKQVLISKQCLSNLYQDEQWQFTDLLHCLPLAMPFVWYRHLTMNDVCRMFENKPILL